MLSLPALARSHAAAVMSAALNVKALPENCALGPHAVRLTAAIMVTTAGSVWMKSGAAAVEEERAVVTGPALMKTAIAQFS